MAGISFTGLASGIDSDAIIKSMGDTRRLAIGPVKKKVEENENENKAFDELNTKLLKLRDAVKDFRTLAGSPISKNAISSDDDSVGVSASNNAQVSSTTVTVTNLAQAATFSFDDRFTSATAPLFPGLTGTANITLTVGTGANATTVDVPVSNQTNLAELVAEIGELSGGKVTASPVNVGTESAPQYILLMQTSESGLEKGSLTVAVDPAITATGALTSSTLSQAEDAVFTVSGIGQITRASNKISGLLPGVTLDLKREGGPILVQVNDDRDKTATKFDSVVGALNELIKYVKENDTITQEEVDGRLQNVYGTLAHARVDNQVLQSIRNAISDSNSGGLGTEVNILADLGLTIERDGLYKIDANKFTEQLATDSVGASTLLTKFADTLGTTNGIIDEYTKFQGQVDISKRTNDDENKSLNDRIERVETNIEKQAQTLKLLFANLEQKIGKLNSTADSLSAMLAGAAARK
ncbi:MAG: flagellar filament capping protein FliD [Deltaproteobacteria bacterium]|nr:flagellar filament capping protein FliD [Deltaproteobacteria bacterium]